MTRWARLRHALAGSSLRVRLLAGTLVWIVASIAVAGWGLSSLFHRHVAQQFHAELKTHLDQLAAAVVLKADGMPALANALSDPRLSKPYSGLYWQIDRVAAAGAPAAPGLLRSRSLWDGLLRVPADVVTDGAIHLHRVPGPDGAAVGLVERTVMLEGAPDAAPITLRLLVAADEQLMVAPVARFSGQLWLALGMLALGLVVAAVVQVAVGLAPLQRLRRALARVRDGQTQQLDGEFPVEIQPLVNEFNSVLGQNAEIVVRARTQAGNLAHALKTPLTVLANAAAAQDSELAHLVREQVDAAGRQVSAHLSRARAAGAASVPGTRTSLRPVVDGLVRVMGRVHAARQIDLKVPQMDLGLVFRGEAQDLQEMLGNLLDNACKWARKHVELRATRAGDRLLIVIDDDGPGIAAQRRDAVLQRGTRDDERVPGSGLGLGIVDDLARLYGGQLELTNSPLGGLRVQLSVPAA